MSRKKLRKIVINPSMCVSFTFLCGVEDIYAVFLTYRKINTNIHVVWD